MLVHQAARQFELVTGHMAPLDAMAAATRGQLAG
jgi:shikimate 5-dehydrogenase